MRRAATGAMLPTSESCRELEAESGSLYTLTLLPARSSRCISRAVSGGRSAAGSGEVAGRAPGGGPSRGGGRGGAEGAGRCAGVALRLPPAASAASAEA
jgi:hypothetical protein